MRVGMLLIGFGVGVGLGWIAFIILANCGIDYALPRLST